MKRFWNLFIVVGIICTAIALQNFSMQVQAKQPSSAAKKSSLSDRKARMLCLQNAISDLTDNFGAEFTSQIQEYKPALKQLINLQSADWDTKFDKLQRDILLKNPLLTRQPIVFTTRRQFKRDHHNTATLFQNGEINTGSFVPSGKMKTLDLKTGEVKTLIETKHGIVRDPDISFDGKRILFSMRKNIRDEFHIYEMTLASGKIRQVTKGAGVADIDPIYLPSGEIVFSGTREPKYCMCNIHVMANLFKVNADGSNLQQLGKSTLFEGHSALLPDGRIIYDRWEYVDRNFGDAQGLWTVNPDGTNHAIYYGNNTPSPGGVINPMPIPGTRFMLALLSSCHDRPWGSLAIIDRERAIDGKAAILRTWPSWAKKLVKDPGKANRAWDTFVKVRPRYEDPYPLNAKYFLVSREMTPNSEKMGIFLLDIFGNETLVHFEEPGCYDPMAICARKKPTAIPDMRDLSKKEGYFYIQNVYQGTHMRGVKKGSAKYLRIIESPEKRTWTKPAWNGQGVLRPAMNWHDFSSKKIIGIVPVEADGSCYFKVPANTFLFFQLLDENMMMIQTMRSGTMVQPGEIGSCVGCHEDRRTTPLTKHSATMLALKKELATPAYSGPNRALCYRRDVQPIFTKHCASCHDFGKPAGKRLILAGDQNPYFNASYIDMWRTWKTRNPIIKPIGAGPAEILQPYTWGAHRSILAKVIMGTHKSHAKINMPINQARQVITWLDMNAPYYPVYSSAYENNLVGRCPLNDNEMKTLGNIVGINFFEPNKFRGHNRKIGPMISFDRPELSPCLQKLDKKSKQYKQALALIKLGKKRLEQTPRADMENFQPDRRNSGQLEHYDNQQKKL